MATYVLDGTDSARLRQGALAISMSVAGPGRARLMARGTSGASSSVIEDRPDLLIVPNVDAELVISVVPYGGARQFAEGTTVYLRVAPDTRDVNLDDIQVSPHEVSGRDFVDLVKISPAGIDTISVRRIGGEDVPLLPLANRARIACRGALGVDAFGAALDVTVGCVIDSSASMARLVADGTVGAATEIFAGLAAAVAGEQPARIVLAGKDITDVPDGPLAELSSRVRKAMATKGFGVGADLDAAIATVSESVQYTIVITDAPIKTGVVQPVSWLKLSESSKREPRFAGAVLPSPTRDADAEQFYHSNPHLIDTAVSALVAPLRGLGG